jgi:hypothetical protein
MDESPTYKSILESDAINLTLGSSTEIKRSPLATSSFNEYLASFWILQRIDKSF